VNWESALADYDRDLRARSAAERTRRAYGVDLGGFVEWARGMGLAPEDVRHRDVRRYAAALSGAGAAATTVARKLAAVRGLYNFLVRTERAAANPAELVSSPKQGEKLPRVLSTEQMRTLLERIPARTPLELRDRAMLELAYSCGLRCEEIVNLDLGALDHETEQLRVLARARRSGCCRSERRPSGRSTATCRRADGRWRSSRGRRRCSSRRAAAASPTPTSPAASASGPAKRRSPPASLLIHLGIPSQLTCWRVGQICVRFRSYSATHRSRPPRSTPVSMLRACVTRTLQATPAPDPAPRPRT
jgi:integrase